jgi:gamma-glutamylcyclotransferase (GGCT)/AIG2-like uncharacterized protein YtfP
MSDALKDSAVNTHTVSNTDTTSQSYPDNFSFTPEHRLVTYGSLGPDRPNHYRLSHIEGTWTQGTVRGNLVQFGWGAAMGYPALVLDEAGPTLDVWVLEAKEMEREWAWLDELEGEEYARVTVPVSTAGGVVIAQIYALSGDGASKP